MTTVEVIVAAAILVGALCVGAEFAARSWLLRRGRPYTWAPYTHTRMVLDRETLPTLEPVVEHRINADGERGDPLPEDRSSLFRVLVVGGSAAECWFLDQESSWPQVVQRVLREPQNLQRLGAQTVHVGSIARSLVAARHIDTVLERILPHYDRLDAIVFMVGASDIVHWLEEGAPPVIEDDLPTSTLFARHPDGPFGWGPRTLALRRIASAWKRRLLHPIEKRGSAGRRLGEARRMRQRAEEILHEVPDPTPMIQGFEYWFARLLERAKAKAPNVIVARQPWLERDFTPAEEAQLWSFATGRPYAGEVTRYYAHEVGWQLHRLVDRSMAMLAERAHVTQVDLMSVVPGDFEHYYDEHHHTPRGCALIGDVIAQAILSSADKSKHVERRAITSRVRGAGSVERRWVPDHGERT
jgi:hypothetical protein